jgi:hypothetical protein
MFRFSKILLPSLVFYLITNPLFSQFTVATYKDNLKAEVSMDQFNDPYAFNIKYQEAPHPSGKAAMRAYLRQRKLDAQKATPLNPNAVIATRGSVPPPEILASFSGNNLITGTPLDNHLAVNQNEEIVSTINTHMLVTNPVGFWMGSYQLENFFSAVGSNNVFFDPRIIYDPVADRFIMALINGSECDDSQIVLAFSKTNNPRGSWNLYALDGCLNDDGTFADYPMLAITETDFFLTYNAVHSDSTWQTGFYGTQIHQINKMNGYNGEPLNRRVWRDVSYNGRLLRNIMPVRNADETLSSSMYFLSTRNFDLTNDTIFFLHLTGEQSDSNATLDITHRLLDIPYGVPPYAVQPRDSLDTNDARVLDAFEKDGQIQWVGNTMDFNSGRSAVFHGMLEVEDEFQTATGNIIAHPTDYLGYPGIAWTGSQPGERDAIIVMSHASATRNPGGSAIYSDGLGGYSEFVSIIEGQRAVDMLQGPIERWGDYVGIQRLYHQPGSCWISCSYGRPGNVNEAWIAKLARQEGAVGTNDPAEKINMLAYPNPTDDYIQLEFDNPEGLPINVVLVNLNGQVIETLYDGPANYPGKANLSFSTHALPAGQYMLHVNLGDTLAATKSVIKL